MIESDGRKRAAVAVVVVDSSAQALAQAAEPEDDRGRMPNVAGGAAFLLSVRAATMNRHAAQWALPGGRVDAGETIEQTALRELDEELGMRLDASAVIGRLDDYGTRSGYVMSPVVIWGGGEFEIVPNPDEVAEVYRIGLHHLVRTDSPRFVEIAESDRPVVQLPLGRDLIHAPTGAVLLQFRWVAMEGRAADDARVDHLEQPVFAWR